MSQAESELLAAARELLLKHVALSAQAIHTLTGVTMNTSTNRDGTGPAAPSDLIYNLARLLIGAGTNVQEQLTRAADGARCGPSGAQGSAQAAGGHGPPNVRDEGRCAMGRVEVAPLQITFKGMVWDGSAWSEGGPTVSFGIRHRDIAPFHVQAPPDRHVRVSLCLSRFARYGTAFSKSHTFESESCWVLLGPDGNKLGPAESEFGLAPGQGLSLGLELGPNGTADRPYFAAGHAYRSKATVEIDGVETVFPVTIELYSARSDAEGSRGDG